MAEARDTSTTGGGAEESGPATTGSVLLALVYLVLANAQMTRSLWPHGAAVPSASGWVVRAVGFVALLAIDAVMVRWLWTLLSRVVPRRAALVWAVLLALLVSVPAVVLAAAAA